MNTSFESNKSLKAALKIEFMLRYNNNNNNKFARK